MAFAIFLCSSFNLPFYFHLCHIYKGHHLFSMHFMLLSGCQACYLHLVGLLSRGTSAYTSFNSFRHIDFPPHYIPPLPMTLLSLLFYFIYWLAAMCNNEGLCWNLFCTDDLSVVTALLLIFKVWVMCVMYYLYGFYVILEGQTQVLVYGKSCSTMLYSQPFLFWNRVLTKLPLNSTHSLVLNLLPSASV